MVSQRGSNVNGSRPPRNVLLADPVPGRSGAARTAALLQRGHRLLRPLHPSDGPSPQVQIPIARCVGGRGRAIQGRRPRGTTVLAYRLAWELAAGSSIPDGLDVLHRCDTRWCVDPTYLELGTHLQNMQDKQRRGRLRTVPRGQRAAVGRTRRHPRWVVSPSTGRTGGRRGRRTPASCRRAAARAWSRRGRAPSAPPPRAGPPRP
jgi:hypothetical protein